MIKKIFKNLIEWLFPFYCLGCQQEGLTVCESCLADIKAYSDNNKCCYCGASSERGLSCPGCGPLDGLWAIFEYQKNQLLSEILHNWKYNQIEDFWLNFRDKVFLPTEFKCWLESEFQAITWIPMSQSKWKLRGFNQSEVIAGQISLKLKCEEFLNKVTDTKAQMSLSRQERLINLKDLFQANERNTERAIIIVDDISTTKATLEEACRALKAAGWEKVYGLVLARQATSDRI